MHEFFAKSYFLDNGNAVVYTDLAEGMRLAIQMKSKEYQRRQSALLKLTEELQTKSLKNLCKQIERMKK